MARPLRCACLVHAARLLACSAVTTLSRKNRVVLTTAVVVTAALLPRTCATVLNVVPSLDTCRSKSRVLKVADSPPAWACRTVTDPIAVPAPRSTVQILVVARLHHLSLVPPETLPLFAFSGPSLALH